MGLNFNSRVCGTNSTLLSTTAHLKPTAVFTERVVTPPSRPSSIFFRPCLINPSTSPIISMFSMLSRGFRESSCRVVGLHNRHVAGNIPTVISVCDQPPRSTQPGHPFGGRRNEYKPKGGNALRVRSKGRYGLCVDGR